MPRIKKKCRKNRECFPQSRTEYFQINLHKSPNSAISLREELKHHNNFLVTVQEQANNKKGKVTHFPPSSRLKVFTKKGESRAAVICTANLSLWFQEDLSDKDICVVLWNTKDPRRSANMNKGILIISAYWPDNSDSEDISKKLQEAIDYAKANNLGIVIGMDSNAHSLLYGAKKQNKRGDNLDKFTIDNNLQPINIGNTPTWSKRNQ